MQKRKAYIKTFGCQMNVHDSEKMAAILEADGYEITGQKRDADLIIYNTCSIREKAEQKFMSDLGRLKNAKSANPGLRIAVAGCIAQQMGESLIKKAPQVDMVIGPQNIHSIRHMLENNAASPIATDENPDATLLELPASRKKGASAWVSIMYGCNNFCTYCIVPYTRGRETSRASQNILNEISGLASYGFKEITLLGQNVNSYKSDIGFTELLYKINAIDNIKRIRFVTNHPMDLSDELAQAMGELDKVCEHIHLPLQSGSDRILKAMNRKYTMEEYRCKISMLREYSPGIAITSDIIAGFPTEEEGDHLRTVEALKSIEFDGIFAFKYSTRPGTRASKMDDHLTEEVKLRRLREILDVQDEITLRRNKALEGNYLEVMAEGPTEADPFATRARTRGNKIVIIKDSPIPQGDILDVRIAQGNKHSLIAEPV